MVIHIPRVSSFMKICHKKMPQLKCRVRIWNKYAPSTDETHGNTRIIQVPYVVGSKSFRPDIQKPRQMENAVRDI